MLRGGWFRTSFSDMSTAHVRAVFVFEIGDLKGCGDLKGIWL